MLLRLNIVLTTATGLLLLFQPRRHEDLATPFAWTLDVLAVVLIAAVVVLLPVSAIMGILRSRAGTKTRKLHIGFLCLWLTIMVGILFIHW